MIIPLYVNINNKLSLKKKSSSPANNFIFLDSHQFSHSVVSDSLQMLKILQARLQQYVNHELPDVLDLEKAEEPEIKLPTSVGSSKKQESSRKIYISPLLTMPKPLTESQ